VIENSDECGRSEPRDERGPASDPFTSELFNSNRYGNGRSLLSATINSCSDSSSCTCAISRSVICSSNESDTSGQSIFDTGHARTFASRFTFNLANNIARESDKQFHRS
jgi:hypothetical protein